MHAWVGCSSGWRRHAARPASIEAFSNWHSVFLNSFSLSLSIGSLSNMLHNLSRSSPGSRGFPGSYDHVITSGKISYADRPTHARFPDPELAMGKEIRV